MIIEGRAYVRGSLQDCCISVENGRITEIKRTLKGDEKLRFGGIILPAGIDLHVHFREPGLTRKEDFLSGTTAAACGGITCAFDMPNTLPPATTPERMEEKVAAVERKAFVDFGLYAGLTEESDLGGLAETATAFKMYMAASEGDLAVGDFSKLLGLKEELSAAGKFISIHCEDPGHIRAGKAKRLEDHLASRPDSAEVGGIEMAEQLKGLRIHVAHISSERGLTSLAGTGFTSEVTPHHLFLNVNCDLGAFAKVNPPLRHKHDQNALWQAFVDGRIDIVASDHAPHTADEKEAGFDSAPAGMPGVETTIPLLLERVRRGNLPLERFVNTICERPAEMLSLKKGRIEVGYDADMIAVDLKRPRRIRADDLHSKCGWTPFEGMSGVFPQTTIFRGEQIVRDGTVIGKPSGRYVGAKH
ncbi:MAG: dihydroorotase [Candidatus Thermoplasmatota archaeon]|nr:dihydroorotase [Candidatus Thermoplasmatota archaeon]